jgi:hypothetical protein
VAFVVFIINQLKEVIEEQWNQAEFEQLSPDRVELEERAELLS